MGAFIPLNSTPNFTRARLLVQTNIQWHSDYCWFQPETAN